MCLVQVDEQARQMELVMEGGHNGKTSSEHALHAVKGQLVTGLIVSATGGAQGPAGVAPFFAVLIPLPSLRLLLIPTPPPSPLPSSQH